MYIYGIVGVGLFSGKYSLLLESERPDRSFDTLPFALLALFEWLCGQDWNGVMYSYIYATNLFSALYFISYILIVTLLFVNLFTGVVLDTFQHIARRLRSERPVAARGKGAGRGVGGLGMGVSSRSSRVGLGGLGLPSRSGDSELSSLPPFPLRGLSTLSSTPDDSRAPSRLPFSPQTSI